MRRLIATAFAMFTASAAMAADCVVLLHGLARSEISFTPMELLLESEGYHVVNRGYPSTTAPIQTLVDEVQDDVAASCSAPG